VQRAAVEFGEIGVLGAQVLLPPDGLDKQMSGSYTGEGMLADYTIP